MSAKHHTSSLRKLVVSHKNGRTTLWSCIVPLDNNVLYAVHFIYTQQVPQKMATLLDKNGTFMMKFMIQSHLCRNISTNFGNNKNTYVCISVDVMLQ